MSLTALVQPGDYPAAALREGQEGRVEFQLSVDTSGRVTRCTISRSSGSAALDSTTCRLMQRRARFTPAVNDKGLTVEGEVRSAIDWELDEGRAAATEGASNGAPPSLPSEARERPR